MDFRLEDYIDFGALEETSTAASKTTDMNPVTQHTWLYRDPPPESTVSPVERLLTTERMDRMENLRWVRAGWDTPTLKVLQDFMDYGNIVGSVSTGATCKS
jgi:hypothetical protein